MGSLIRGRRSRSWFVASVTLLTFGGVAVPTLAGAGTAPSAPRTRSKAASEHAPKPVSKPADTPSTGTIEICKSSQNEMAGRTFQFSLNGGAPISVVGGGCSAPIVAPAGNATVIEAPTNDTRVAAVRSARLVSKNLATSTATVTVKAGSTPANETVVTFVNRLLPPLGLKVCKSADPNDTSLIGDLFSFTENGGPAFSVATGTVAAPVCGPLTKYPLATVVNVAELATTMTHASAITVSDNRGSNVNLKQGTVTATVGAGVTIVTYTNAVNPIPQFGFIEVCAAAHGPFVTGDFRFTITAPGFKSRQQVTVAQCSEAVQVPAGPVTIAEASGAHSFTSSIKVVPKNRLVSGNVTNQTATVMVPVGDTSTESMVTFTNTALTGQVKVCKTLAANSTALAGAMFTFKVTSAVGHPQTDTVVAGAAGSTACVMHKTALPLGSPVSITETGVANVQTVGVSVSPANRDTGSVSPTANFTVGSGVTTATFTNEAFGTIEVCKTAADASTATQTFQFSVNGAAAISVHAGQCSPAITVPAGTATINEVAQANFRLVGVTAVGPILDNRLTSGATVDPATVLVPFGGGSNETVVTFTNAVVTGQLKICKVSSEPTLQGVTFNFTYSYTLNGSPVTGNVALQPGQCSGLSAGVPVVAANGTPIPIAVTEVEPPTAQVSSIAVANGTLVASNIGAGTSTVNVNAGVTMLTYTNIRTPLGTLQVCKAAADSSTATQTFQFSVNGGAPIGVAAGSCSPTMSGLSGTATVQELASANFHLVGITAVGPLNVNRLTTAPTANPATVSVPSGDATNATVVTFTNAVDTGQLAICKASTEPTLQSTAFNFDYQYSVGTTNVSGSASLAPGHCTTLADPIPLVDPGGNPIPVSIFEDATVGVDLGNVAVDNGTLTGTDLVGGSTTAFVDPGVTTVTFTNVLPRTLMVCKKAADPSTASQTFQFSVNGGPAITVAAGACSASITLPVSSATATVSELGSTNFHLVGVSAVGFQSDNRLMSGPTDNPATVSVPFGGSANLTFVAFTNAVNTGEFRICKASAEPTLQGVSFTFNDSYDPGSGAVPGTASLTPGGCSDPSAPIPVVDANGAPIPISISEVATAGVAVTFIGVDNGTLSGSDLGAGTTTAFVQQGLTTVTFTNGLSPPAPG